jgi:hypothetical protein
MRPHAGNRQEPRADLKKPLTMQQLSIVIDFPSVTGERAHASPLVAPFSSTCSVAEQVDEKGEGRRRKGEGGRVLPPLLFPFSPLPFRAGRAETF